MIRIGWLMTGLALAAACRTTPETAPTVEKPESRYEWPAMWRTDLPRGTGETMPGPLAGDILTDLRVETPMVVNPEMAVHPDVSRDGTKLVYARKVDDGTWQVFKQDLKAGGAEPAPTRLSYSGANHLFPRLSPDGQWVAFASDRNGQWDIFVVHVDAPAAVQQVTDTANDEVCPSWSPDSKRIAYSMKTARGHWQVCWAVRATRVHTYLGPGIYPDWHPTKDLLVFQSQPIAPTDYPVVNVIRIDGSHLDTVAEGGTFGCVMPRWSHDGGWVVYATIRRSRESLIAGAREEADDMWAVRGDGTDLTRLSDDPAPEWWPVLAKERLFFVSWHEGHQVITSGRRAAILSSGSTDADSAGR